MLTLYSHKLIVLCVLFFGISNIQNIAYSQCTATGLTANAFADPAHGNTITANLDWDDVVGAEAYQVNYKVIGGNNFFTTVLSVSEFTLYNLDINTDYTWRVNVKCNGTWVGWQPFIEEFTTPNGTVCQVDGHVSSVSTDTNGIPSADISWNAHTGADMYQVSYRIVGSGQLYSDVLTVTSLSLTNLSPNATYTWRVRVSCNGNWGTWPDYTEQFNTPAGVSCEASDLASEVIDDGNGNISANLSWFQSSIAEEFQVNYRAHGGPHQFSPNLETNSFSISDLESNTNYTWRVRTKCDGVWNSWPSFTESFMTTTIDTTPPTVITKNISVALNEFGTATISPEDINDGSMDENGSISLALDMDSFDCTQMGDNTVTLTATDEAGNVASGTAVITIIDNIAPMVQTQNITLALDDMGAAIISADQVNLDSNDACGIASMEVDQTTFDCTHTGDNLVTLTTTDGAGNSSSASAIVTIVDNIAPVILGQDLSVTLDESGNAVISASDLDNGSTDACGIASLNLSQTSFDCSHVGENEVTLTGTDNNGNQASTTVMITIADETTPEVTASLDKIRGYGKSHGGNHGIYSVNFSAEDQCSEDVDVEAVILTPDMDGYSVKLKRRWFGQKVRIDTKSKKIEVYARNPQALYESIVEKGGLKVYNEAWTYLKLNNNSHKYEYRLYKGWLYAASAPEIVLQATATDDAGNIAQATYELGNNRPTENLNARTRNTEENIEEVEEEQEEIVAEVADTNEDEFEEALSTELIAEPSIYPVPSSGTFNLNLQGSIYMEEAVVSMFDVSGSLVQQISWSAQNQPIGTVQLGGEQLREGIYLINIKSTTASFNQRVLIQRN